MKSKQKMKPHLVKGNGNKNTIAKHIRGNKKT